MALQLNRISLYQPKTTLSTLYKLESHYTAKLKMFIKNVGQVLEGCESSIQYN